MVRHKKGYSTVAILIVAILFVTAAVIHQSSTIETIAHHQPSVQIFSNSRKQANSSANSLNPSAASSISPAKGPNFSSPTIFSPSTIPNPTATQQISTIAPTDSLK